jgi:hypothetical protein
MESITPLVLQAGLGCLAAQCCLYVLFAYIVPPGPWRESPGFTAHQAICFPLMVALMVVGAPAWFFPDTETTALSSTLQGRVVDVHATGHMLGQVVLGELVLWDIPCSVMIKSLREPLMFAHHLGMALVAYTTMSPLGSYYSLFFFGAIEISGVPLSFVDTFHPKHVHWCDYLKVAPRLNALNEVARVAFAAAYLPLRAVYFPYVIFTSVVPDMLAALRLAHDERPRISDTGLIGLLGGSRGIRMASPGIRVLGSEPWDTRPGVRVLGCEPDPNLGIRALGFQDCNSRLGSRAVRIPAPGMREVGLHAPGPEPEAPARPFVPDPPPIRLRDPRWSRSHRARIPLALRDRIWARLRTWLRVPNPAVDPTRSGSHSLWIPLVAVFGILFSMLQMYWGTLVFGQVTKALGFSGKKPKKALE